MAKAKPFVQLGFHQPLLDEKLFASVLKGIKDSPIPRRASSAYQSTRGCTRGTQVQLSENTVYADPWASASDTDSLSVTSEGGSGSPPSSPRTLYADFPDPDRVPPGNTEEVRKTEAWKVASGKVYARGTLPNGQLVKATFPPKLQDAILMAPNGTRFLVTRGFGFQDPTWREATEILFPLPARPIDDVVLDNSRDKFMADLPVMDLPKAAKQAADDVASRAMLPLHLIASELIHELADRLLGTT